MCGGGLVHVCACVCVCMCAYACVCMKIYSGLLIDNGCGPWVL